MTTPEMTTATNTFVDEFTDRCQRISTGSQKLGRGEAFLAVLKIAQKRDSISAAIIAEVVAEATEALRDEPTMEVS